MVLIAAEELARRCEGALVAAGATPAQAALLASDAVDAERYGRATVGVAHLLDYVDGFRQGRITVDRTPVVTPRGEVIALVDCAGGLAQHGFAEALPWLCQAAEKQGLAVLGINSCFTAGELGSYVRRLTDQGLLGMVVANSPAAMAAVASRDPLLGTNPIAFGAPVSDGPPITFDQAASATAWVAIRRAADQDQPLASGVAVDSAGRATTSAAEALKGAVLPFGGYKGANLALMVELLAALVGGSFSCEAAPFDRGATSPSVGMFVLALSPAHFDPDFAGRLADQLEHWQQAHGAIVGLWRPQPGLGDHIDVPETVLAHLDQFGQGVSTC